MEIYIRSRFTGWEKSNKEDALTWAKWAIRAIQCGKTNKDILIVVNSKLKEIQFTLQELEIKE